MCELSLLFGHKQPFEVHVVMLSQRRLHTCCQNTLSSQMRWLLKGMAGGTLIGLLHVMPKTHLRVSDRPILDLCRAQEPFTRRHNSNSAIEPPTKLLRLCVSRLRLRPSTL